MDYKNICNSQADLKNFSKKELYILAKYLKLPTNIDKTDLRWMIAISLFNSNKSYMPTADAQKFQSESDQYLKKHEYHDKVNSLPNYIKTSLLDYIGDQSYKYMSPQYENIDAGIQMMPPITKELVLFRGQDIPAFIPEKWFSTSIEQNASIEGFTKSDGDCCLFILYVQPGTKILPVYELRDNKYHKSENEVIVQGGGYLKLIKKDTTKNIKTFEYTYSMKNGQIDKPPQSQLAVPKLEKDIPKLAKMIDADEISEYLDLYEQSPTKENIIEIIKELYQQLQTTQQLPFTIDDSDYNSIYDIIYG